MVDQLEIHRKLVSSRFEKRFEAVMQLFGDFANLPDKMQAWEDLIWLTQSDLRLEVRCWHNIKDLLIGDRYRNLRYLTVVALNSAFHNVSDKDAAWKDLIRLIQGDSRWVVRCWHSISNSR